MVREGRGGGRLCTEDVNETHLGLRTTCPLVAAARLEVEYRSCSEWGLLGPSPVQYRTLVLPHEHHSLPFGC